MWRKAKLKKISRQPTPLQIMIGQKQLDNVEYIKKFWQLDTTWCKMYTWNEIKDCYCKIGIKQEGESFHQQIGLKFKEETSEVLHLDHSIVWCCNLDTSEGYQKCLQSFEMWCWRRMENISWNRLCEKWVMEWNILRTIKRKKANWIGHILHRNCLLKHIV
jgi:hypothetical protein